MYTEQLIVHGLYAGQMEFQTHFLYMVFNTIFQSYM